MAANPANAKPLRQPALYLPHGGGPCFFMDYPPGRNPWAEMGDFLRQLPQTLPERPRAILVVSGHWEAPSFAVNTGEAPPLLYDYYGFPEHTYRLSYPAPGAPALARRVRELLGAAGLQSQEDAARGFDHGVFVPMLLVDPQAGDPGAAGVAAAQPGSGPASRRRPGAGAVARRGRADRRQRHELPQHARLRPGFRSGVGRLRRLADRCRHRGRRRQARVRHSAAGRKLPTPAPAIRARNT